MAGTRARTLHPRFGEGEILETRFGGFEARVDFGGFAVWVPAVDLETMEAPQEPAPRDTTNDAPGDNKNLARRRLIESLRLGIVPDAELRAWTVGRAEEMAALQGWLDEEEHGTLIVEGRYGAGKTHLLRCVRSMAEEAGFAVAQVRVDPGQENASFPLRFYRSVMAALRIPYDGAVLDIRHALGLVADGTLKRTTLDRHPFLGKLLERIRAGEDTEADWGGLQGERSESKLLPSALDFTTVANLSCNLLSAISRFVTLDLGLRGLIILVDEVETAEVRRYHYHWLRTLNFLRGLSLTANDEPELEETTRRDEKGTRRGTRTGLVYSGHHPDIPYTAGRPSHLKVVLALTECRVSGHLAEWRDGQPRVLLSDLEPGALQTLFRNITASYAELYHVRPPRHLDRWLVDAVLLDAFRAGSIRAFGKATVEVLDFIRHHPGEPLEAVEAYRTF